MAPDSSSWGLSYFCLSILPPCPNPDPSNLKGLTDHISSSLQAQNKSPGSDHGSNYLEEGKGEKNHRVS